MRKKKDCFSFGTNVDLMERIIRASCFYITDGVPEKEVKNAAVMRLRCLREKTSLLTFMTRKQIVSWRKLENVVIKAMKHDDGNVKAGKHVKVTVEDLATLCYLIRDTLTQEERRLFPQHSVSKTYPKELINRNPLVEAKP